MGRNSVRLDHAEREIERQRLLIMDLRKRLYEVEQRLAAEADKDESWRDGFIG